MGARPPRPVISSEPLFPWTSSVHYVQAAHGECKRFSCTWSGTKERGSSRFARRAKWLSTAHRNARKSGGKGIRSIAPRSGSVRTALTNDIRDYNCTERQRDAERIPKYKAVLEQFPWTDVGYNIEGRFNEQFVLLQFGVLGTSRQRVGYWAYHERRDVADEVLDAPWSPLTEDEGWRLPKELIPSLALHDSDTCPAFPPTFETNWTSYYQWRGLPMASPAAILLHWPLAVYACLKELGLLQSATDLRKKLTVFYVGARVHIALASHFCHLSAAV